MHVCPANLSKGEQAVVTAIQLRPNVSVDFMGSRYGRETITRSVLLDSDSQIRYVFWPEGGQPDPGAL